MTSRDTVDMSDLAKQRDDGGGEPEVLVTIKGDGVDVGSRFVLDCGVLGQSTFCFGEAKGLVGPAGLLVIR